MRSHANVWLLVVMVPVILWSAYRPFDRLTWWLEVVPVLVVFVALFVAQRRGWRLSNLALLLIGLHMVVLLVGGHYTYARVPVGDWVRQALDLPRNHYDRLGHLMQGLVPAIVCREIFVRNRVFARAGWMSFCVVCVCLAGSAVYELIEWAAALASAEAAESFLGTQGDQWDTQADMFLAFVGALMALLFLSRLHDRSMARLAAGGGSGSSAGASLP
jgi:putative membrane protein